MKKLLILGLLISGCGGIPNPGPCPPFCFLTPTPPTPIVEEKTPTPTPTKIDPAFTSTPTPTRTKLPTNTPMPQPMPTGQPFQSTDGEIKFIVTGLETVPVDDDDAVIETSAWEQDLNLPDRTVPVIGIHFRAGKFTFRFSNKIIYDQYIYPIDNDAEQCGTGTHPSIAQEAKNGTWTITWRNNFLFNEELYSEIIVRSPVAIGNEFLNWRPQVQTPRKYGEFFAATTGTLGLRWKVSAKGTFGLGSFYKGAQWKPQDKRYHADNRPIWNWPGIAATFTSMTGKTGTLIPCPKMIPTKTPTIP